jgi:hypothetical protein
MKKCTTRPQKCLLFFNEYINKTSFKHIKVIIIHPTDIFSVNTTNSDILGIYSILSD